MKLNLNYFVFYVNQTLISSTPDDAESDLRESFAADGVPFQSTMMHEHPPWVLSRQRLNISGSGFAVMAYFGMMCPTLYCPDVMRPVNFSG